MICRYNVFLIALCTLFLYNCRSDDTLGCVEHPLGDFQDQFDSAEGLEKYDVITEYFEYLTQDTVLITRAELIEHESLILEAEDGSALCIPSFFYGNNVYDLSRGLLQLNLSNGEAIAAPYYQKWDALTTDSISVNPYGSNPLCAAWHVQGPANSIVHLTLIGKNGPSSNLSINFKLSTELAEIPILGLYQNHMNKILVTFQSKRGSVFYQDTINIQTASISLKTATIDIVKKTSAEMTAGFNLVSARLHPIYDVPYMFDQDGELRWILDVKDIPNLNRLRYDVGIERLQNGNWYFGDINSSKIFEIGLLGNLVNTWDLSPYIFHHKVQEKTNGNFLVSVSNSASPHLNGRPTKEDFIIEIDRNSGEIITEWDLKQSLDEYRTSFIDNLSNSVVDWLHVNAIYSDDRDGSIIISGRHQGTIKLTYENEIVWILAPHHEWTVNRRGEDLNQFLLQPIDQDGNIIIDSMVVKGYEDHPHFEWSWGQHAISKTSNGNLILFDNGDRRNHQTSSKYSRIVEYKIDETNKTIQQIWTFGKELGKSYYSQVASNIQYDALTDNFFMNGGFAIVNPDGLGGRTIEVDRQTKTIVFEATITTEHSRFVFHRVNRLSIYPD